MLMRETRTLLGQYSFQRFEHRERSSLEMVFREV